MTGAKQTVRSRQSTCMACGKRTRPGAGIVMHYGAGGRISKPCHATAQQKAPSERTVNVGQSLNGLVADYE